MSIVLDSLNFEQHIWKHKKRFKFRKVVLWASHPNIIAFSKPNNGKYENQLLIWKVLSFLCTLSRLHLLCPNCPSVSPAQHHPNLHITFSHLEAFSHLSSLLKTQNLSFQFRNPNPKLQDSVKMRLSAHLGAMGVQENSRKTKWSSGGVPKNRNPNFQMCLKLVNLCPR